MKIRNGFVSNSSSSSFVVLLKKNDYDKYINSAHPYYKYVMDQMEFTELTIENQSYITIIDYESSEDYIEDMNLEDYEGEVLSNDGKVIKGFNIEKFDEDGCSDYPMSPESVCDVVVKGIKQCGGLGYYKSIIC